MNRKEVAAMLASIVFTIIVCGAMVFTAFVAG